MTGSGFLDVDDAEEYAALMRQAHAIVGSSAADVDQAATEDFMEWAQGMGVQARIGRELDDDGRMVWGIEIRTGRGTLSRRMSAAGEWRQAVEELGLA